MRIHVTMPCCANWTALRTLWSLKNAVQSSADSRRSRLQLEREERRSATSLSGALAPSGYGAIVRGKNGARVSLIEGYVLR